MVLQQMMRVKIFGTSLEISFLVLASMTAIFIFDKKGSIIICFFSALFHEIGHLLAMKITGYRPLKIKLRLFDIQIIDNNRTARRFTDDLFIVLSGVIFNLIAFLVAICIFQATKNIMFLKIAVINASIGIFNAMPVSTLDGGQAIFILCCRRFSPDVSAKILDVMTFVMIFPTAIVGFLILFNSKYNFSLLIISVYLIIVLVMKKSKFF